MKKLKEICQFLDQHHIKYERSENNQYIYIHACEVGDNFYDYDESPKPICYNAGLEWIKDDPRIIISECADCCCCSGW